MPAVAGNADIAAVTVYPLVAGVVVVVVVVEDFFFVVDEFVGVVSAGLRLSAGTG